MNITEKEFQQLTGYIREHYGIKLGQEKRALVLGRLTQILAKQNMPSFTAYFEHLIADDSGQAVYELLNRITTNHTYFMREPAHFTIFEKRVLPWVREMAADDRDARIWSAGCSRGQEPYTLAMIMQDFFGHDKMKWSTQILATDISQQALTAASSGVYAAEETEPLPDRWKKMHFHKTGLDQLQVNEALRSQLVIRRFNLMNQQFPFKKKFHVIFCRNVMIYFDGPTKRDLVKRFHQHLLPGGYLFIGHSESLGRENSGFQYVQPAVYRKEQRS